MQLIASLLCSGLVLAGCGQASYREAVQGEDTGTDSSNHDNRGIWDFSSEDDCFNAGHDSFEARLGYCNLGCSDAPPQRPQTICFDSGGQQGDSPTYMYRACPDGGVEVVGLGRYYDVIEGWQECDPREEPCDCLARPAARP